jgi:hypothetical protein
VGTPGRPTPGGPHPGSTPPSAASAGSRPRTTWSSSSAFPCASSMTFGVGPPPATSTCRVASPTRRWKNDDRTLPLCALATGTTVVTRIATPCLA